MKLPLRAALLLSVFSPLLPAQLGAADTVLIDQGAPATALIPSTANGGSALGDSWTGVADPSNVANWQNGTLGLGYEANSGYQTLIGIDLIAMQGVNASAFLRVPFELDAAGLASIRALQLRMKYDDGFVAWINGVRVAAVGAPDPLEWDSDATSNNPDSSAIVFEDFDVSSAITSLRVGSNVLAIQAMNDSPSSSDLLALPQLVASDIEPPVWPELVATQIASGLSRPVDIQHAGDGSGRLFIVEKLGRIRIYKDGALQSTSFLDIESRVDDISNEEGLLGLAFPPNFATDAAPHFYVCYTASGSRSLLSRFSVDPSNPDRALANSEEILLSVSQPFGNHNGGQIQFGPKGYLYVGLGDGGSGNDPGDRGQDGSSLLGKMLRLDVETTPPAGDTYVVPSDNPFLNDATVRDEIWALGLRNPWRFSFDRKTDDLWIADVGQNAFEEINFQPASSPGGENYGWRYFEAFRTNLTTGVRPIDPVDPIHDYGRAVGTSITGGYVYRGSRYPRMDGVYLYVDYNENDFVGVQRTAEGEVSTQTLMIGSTGVTTFGEDEAGELYFATDTFGSLSNRVFALSDIQDDSYLQIVALTGSPSTGIDVSVGTQIGEEYQMESSSDLDVWEAVGTVERAGSLQTSFVLPPAADGEAPAFLRVRAVR